MFHNSITTMDDSVSIENNSGIHIIEQVNNLYFILQLKVY